MQEADIQRWSAAQALMDEVLTDPRPATIETARERARTFDCVRELEALLDALDTDSALDASLDDAIRDIAAPRLTIGALEGRRFGRWTLGGEIGRGGMSVVYHAFHEGQEFEQHAALKLLSLSFASQGLVDSFLRERRILSGLQHPGIAGLIDGGVTEDGSPWLVMEYVDGMRIDQWCQEHSAGAREVVALVEALCRAVAYAQQRLVIHRDINAANVLIDHQGRPVLIDFGIAGLMGRDGRRTVHAFTPAFAAPEQVAGENCTTATDVFAIGRLLASLLPEPSGDRDLDLLVATATRNEPDRRYANARELADDLRAWLELRPLKARPPSLSYRLGRFVARNRWAVTATALLVLALAGGLATVLWQARIVAQERDEARLQGARATQVTGFLEDLFQAADPDVAEGEKLEVRELLDLGGRKLSQSFEADPEIRADLYVLLGGLYEKLGEAEAAFPLLLEGLALAEAQGDMALCIEGLRALARTHMLASDFASALTVAERAEALLAEEEQVPGALHSALAEPILFSLTELGRVEESIERGEALLAAARSDQKLPEAALYDYLHALATVLTISRNDDARAGALLEEAGALDIAAQAEPTARIALLSNLATNRARAGDVEAALALRQEALALADRVYPPQHVSRARLLSNLASVLNQKGDGEAALDALREALAIYQAVYGDTAHLRVAAAYNNLGNALQHAGRFEEAEPPMAQAQQLTRELLGVEDPRYAITTANLGNLHRQLGWYESADSLLEESLRLRLAIHGPDNMNVGATLGLLAFLRLDQGRFGDALALCDEALALYQRIGFDQPLYRVSVMSRRGRALAGLGRTAEAAAQFEEATGLVQRTGAAAGAAAQELQLAIAAFEEREPSPAPLAN